MDSLFMTLFEITYIEGIFTFVLNFIFICISTNNELCIFTGEKLNELPLLIKLAHSCDYEGKTYLDNNFIKKELTLI